MITLYIVSTERATGKTAISAGLGKHLLGDGKKVGFFKPLVADGGNTAQAADADAVFMKQVLALTESADSLCPLMSAGEVTADKIREACVKAAPGKDVVIVEGISGPGPDGLSQASYGMARALEARVIAVEAYSPALSSLMDGYKGFGESLLGIVVNKVPKSQLKRVREEISAQFGAAGINVLGVLPEDRVLLAPTVGEVAGYIQGKILNSEGKSAELVESLIVGALSVDSGLGYFGRKANKAAIVRGDRPDMQMAALETPTRCLVLSGPIAAVYYRVLQKAEDKGIPIIQAESDAGTIITRIEDALTRARFAQDKKLPRLAEIMKPSFDFAALYKGVGLGK